MACREKSIISVTVKGRTLEPNFVVMMKKHPFVSHTLTCTCLYFSLAVDEAEQADK